MAKNNKKELETQMRVKNYEIQRDHLLQSGYQEYIGTISALKANLMVFITAGPFAIIAHLIFLVIWKDVSFHFNFSDTILFFIAYLISIPVHEFIHGFTWHFFCKMKWKSIHFGIMWEAFMPYCHCKEPLKFYSYLLGGLMPFFVLGIGFTVISVILHSPFLLFFSIINILSAGGDTTIAFMLFKYRNCIILDHPTQCGFAAFSKSN